MSQPTVSIVIRCFNEERHIKRLLEGILSQNWKDLEVILVDSGSSDRTLEMARLYPVRLVSISPEDFSFGYSLNVGCRHAGGRFLAFISAHCFPSNSMWLEALVKPFDDPGVGLVYGKQRGDKNTCYFEHQIFRNQFPVESVPRTNHPFCNNANCAIRRELWDQFPYDEELTGLEDLAWARKIVSAGYYLAYSSEAEVIHVHDETREQRFNRYKREAIALRRIVPESHFTTLDFVRLYGANCARDLVSAFREGLLRSKFIEILTCRWHQFAGTLSGYRVKDALAKDLKMQFFYPESFTSQRSTESNAGMASNGENVSTPSWGKLPRIVALVPMRADSKRVPNKNIRLFNGKPLYFYILNTLLDCRHIEEVYVNTNSPILMEEIPRSFDRVRIIPRPDNLCADTVPMNDILLYDVDYVRAEWYLQTHATNPLLKSETITRAVETMLAGGEHDSLFSVTPMFTRLYDSGGHPINHDPNVLLRTQDLDPVYEENSNIYIFKADTLKKRGNRIGELPIMFEIPREEAWDIDEELDFRVAEFLHVSRKLVEPNQD